jgi:hypothetical protein
MVLALLVMLIPFFGHPTAAPTVPPAQTPGSNIAVTECTAQLDPPPLKIGFRNTASDSATEVDFAVVGVGTITTVADRGTFAPSKPVTHEFALPQGTSPLGLSSARCIVTKVIYSTGRTWTNPNPP